VLFAEGQKGLVKNGKNIVAKNTKENMIEKENMLKYSKAGFGDNPRLIS
jgi:hypothetical protein